MAPIPKTYTDAAGEFRLTGVMPGFNVLVINKKNLQPHVRPMVKVKAGKEKNVRKIRLKEGERAAGRVVDEEDNPVVGADVVVANKSGTVTSIERWGRSRAPDWRALAPRCVL